MAYMGNEVKLSDTYLFHPFSHLCTLRIFITVDWRPNRFSINPLTSFLNKSILPSSLQTLDICVKAAFSVGPDHVVQCICSPDKQTEWRRFDAVLAEPRIATIPRLRLFFYFTMVNLRMDQSDFGDSLFIARTRKGVEEILPGFRQTRILSLTGQISVVCNQFDSSGFLLDMDFYM